MWPVYLSSNGAAVEDEEEDPNKDMYESFERAGRFKARPALRRSGFAVVEKLYGAELLSKVCTWESSIFRFSSIPTRQVSIEKCS